MDNNPAKRYPVMIPKGIAKLASTLLKSGGFQEPYKLTPLSGGRNSRVFLCRHGYHIAGVLKHYYFRKGDIRDKMDCEWRFSNYLWNHTITQAPKPLVADHQNHSALYSYIDGHKVIPERVTRNHIDQAMDFYSAINVFRKSADAKNLQNGSESCFSVSEHINLIDMRVSNLKKIPRRTQVDRKASAFIESEVFPAWEKVCDTAYSSEKDFGIPFDTQIHLTDRRLSPSDFGFHNALEDDQGRLFFLDFEHAGWDDPAKMVCDFFCQPAIPVPRKFYAMITKRVVGDLSEPDFHRQRIELLLPAYRIKWCCIVLNDFLPYGRMRKKFIDAASDSEKNKEVQLQKATDIIQNLSQ